MTAEFEEVVIASNTFKLKDFRPNLCDDLFRFALRGNIVCRELGTNLIRDRKRFAIDLAVTCQWKRSQENCAPISRCSVGKIDASSSAPQSCASPPLVITDCSRLPSSTTAVESWTFV